jgi:hypothetical protein
MIEGLAMSAQRGRGRGTQETAATAEACWGSAADEEVARTQFCLQNSERNETELSRMCSETS